MPRRAQMSRRDLLSQKWRKPMSTDNQRRKFSQDSCDASKVFAVVTVVEIRGLANDLNRNALARWN
jgi:ribosomal protein L32E